MVASTTTTAKNSVSHNYGYIYDGGKLPRYYGDLSYHSLGEDGDHSRTEAEYEMIHPNDIVKHEASRMESRASASSSFGSSSSILLQLITGVALLKQMLPYL